MLKKRTLLSLIFVVIFGIIYYHMTAPPLEQVSVERVIDGDTVVLENDQRLRLIGINSPEKGMPYYDISRMFLESRLKEKDVYLETTGTDRYDRILGYLYADDENMNLELLKNGLAHLYYYEKDEKYEMMRSAEESARENDLGIWKDSKKKHCIELILLDYYDKKGEKETLILKNTCKEKIDIIIKDDATHIFDVTIEPGTFKKEFKNTFNDDSDTLYVWDKEGKLLLFYRYP